MKTMTLAAMAASALLGMSTVSTGVAMAGDPVQCRQQAELICTVLIQFQPGTPEWQSCVDSQTYLCIVDAAAPILPPIAIKPEF